MLQSPLFCSQNVHVHIVDMSSARQVWEFAQNFSQNHTVHVLVCVCRNVRAHLWFTPRIGLFSLFVLRQINNAGCMVNQRELTEEGLEKNFATNTLGEETNCSDSTRSFLRLENLKYTFILLNKISYFRRCVNA